jgi:hypothetical protein
MNISAWPNDPVTLSIHQIDKSDTEKLNKLIPNLKWETYGTEYPVVSTDIKIGNIKIEFYQKGTQTGATNEPL